MFFRDKAFGLRCDLVIALPSPRFVRRRLSNVENSLRGLMIAEEGDAEPRFWEEFPTHQRW